MVPLVLVLLVGALVWRGERGWKAPRRAALGGCLYLGGLCFLLGLHEFAFGGYFMEYLYYFNLLLPAMSFCFGALCFYSSATCLDRLAPARS
ncbi:MAG: hypothetical protein M3546_00340 [Actinomycetota bacterium]|nr:hypothetical protein [Actinomycetota bacterium]